MREKEKSVCIIMANMVEKTLHYNYKCSSSWINRDDIELKNIAAMSFGA